jgi:hypothetical protein
MCFHSSQHIIETDKPSIKMYKEKKQKPTWFLFEQVTYRKEHQKTKLIIEW